jgi:hypothetical protein
MRRSLDVLHMFPSIKSAGRRFASLHRVLRGEFPCFDGTTKALRLPAARLAALRCLRLAVPQRPLVRFALWRTSAPPKPGVGDPVTPAGISLRRRQDIPSSWGTPIVRLHMFHSDAGRTADTRPLQCRDVALGARKAKAPTKGLSTLNSMAFGLAVYASQCGLPRPTQNSLPAAGQALPDGLSTRKVPLKGFRYASYMSSSLPKLSWRNRANRSAKPSGRIDVPRTRQGQQFWSWYVFRRYHSVE